MTSLLRFIEANRDLFEFIKTLNAVVTLVVWCVGALVLLNAWRMGSLRRARLGLGPLSVEFMEAAAVEATAAATRDWQGKGAGMPASVDVARIRSTVSQAFTPEAAQHLIGKSILWVDDNPDNNTLAVRALRRFQLDVDQVTSTELGLDALRRRHYDLIISDMGRGDNMRAGYDLLSAIRATGNQVPFLIFAGSDKPEFRQEATRQGAQLSTNDMLELIQSVIQYLGR